MCSAFGETPAEALTEVEAAKRLWLESARAEGKPIPEPRYRPVIYKLASYSGVHSGATPPWERGHPCPP